MHAHVFSVVSRVVAGSKILNVRRRAYRRRLNCKHEHNRMSETFFYPCVCECLCCTMWARRGMVEKEIRWRFDTIVVGRLKIFFLQWFSRFFFFFFSIKAHKCLSAIEFIVEWAHWECVLVCHHTFASLLRPSKHENCDNGALQTHVNQNLL